MKRLGSLGVNLVATFFIWLAAGMVDVVTGESGAARDAIMIITILAAFGGTAALWLIWALTDYSQHTSPASEKSKRHAGNEDARLALLLELMGEDERQALKQRLTDELSDDGESISLAQLLAAQKDDRR
jgi:hypothetical protein